MINDCESCGQPNGWPMVDNVYLHVCGACAEKKRMLFVDGSYRVPYTCRGCARIGAANYDDGKELAFYCRSSDSCIP